MKEASALLGPIAVTAGMMVLASAVLLNPIMFLLTFLAGLIAAIYAYSLLSTSRTDNAQKLHDEVQAARDKYEVYENFSQLQSEIDAAIGRIKEKKNKTRQKIILKVDQRENTVSCPLCMDELNEAIVEYDGWVQVSRPADVYHCEHCNMSAHLDCLNEMGGGRCPTLGCRKKVMVQA